MNSSFKVFLSTVDLWFGSAITCWCRNLFLPHTVINWCFIRVRGRPWEFQRPWSFLGRNKYFKKFCASQILFSACLFMVFTPVYNTMQAAVFIATQSNTYKLWFVLLYTLSYRFRITWSGWETGLNFLKKGRETCVARGWDVHLMMIYHIICHSHLFSKIRGNLVKSQNTRCQNRRNTHTNQNRSNFIFKVVAQRHWGTLMIREKELGVG